MADSCTLVWHVPAHLVHKLKVMILATDWVPVHGEEIQMPRIIGHYRILVATSDMPSKALHEDWLEVLGEDDSGEPIYGYEGRLDHQPTHRNIVAWYGPIVVPKYAP